MLNTCALSLPLTTLTNLQKTTDGDDDHYIGATHTDAAVYIPAYADMALWGMYVVTPGALPAHRVQFISVREFRSLLQERHPLVINFLSALNQDKVRAARLKVGMQVRHESQRYTIESVRYVYPRLLASLRLLPPSDAAEAAVAGKLLG